MAPTAFPAIGGLAARFTPTPPRWPPRSGCEREGAPSHRYHAAEHKIHARPSGAVFSAKADSPAVAAPALAPSPIASRALPPRARAEAAFHLIRWKDTGFCQVWDESVPTEPWPSNYNDRQPPNCRPSAMRSRQGRPAAARHLLVLIALTATRAPVGALLRHLPATPATLCRRTRLLSSGKTTKQRKRAMPLLANHIAVVTGAGSGIGRAIANGYAREGARVVIARHEREGGGRRRQGNPRRRRQGGELRARRHASATIASRSPRTSPTRSGRSRSSSTMPASPAATACSAPPRP